MNSIHKQHYTINSNHYNESININSSLLNDLNDEKRTTSTNNKINNINSYNSYNYNNNNNNNNNNNEEKSIDELEFNNNNKDMKYLDLSKRMIYSLDLILGMEIENRFQNDFKSISILNLNDNLLGEIPESLKQLTQLVSLSIRGNHILEIPKWFPEEFKLLRKLDVSHNALSMVPSTFNKFSILEDLNLSNNYISYIHPSLFPEGIMRLNLSNNLFREVELPPWFESLLTLDISGNKLKHLGNLPFHLVKVSIDDNHLESIDHKVILRNKDLALKFNQSFSDIVLERIYQCWYTGDPVLDLSGLGMCVVPPILGMLVHLTHLDLSGNCISVLPPELANLTELVRLDLSFNILTTLPLYIVSYKRLEHLDLQGTLDTLVSPPRRIAETGKLIDIQRYFHDLFQGEPSYRVKLMIVGQENVGKTSLVKCLKMKKKFSKNADHLGTNVSTDGIDIDEIKFNLDIELPSNQSSNSLISNSLSNSSISSNNINSNNVNSNGGLVGGINSNSAINSNNQININSSGGNIINSNNNNNNNNNNVNSNGTHSNNSSGGSNSFLNNTNSNGTISNNGSNLNLNTNSNNINSSGGGNNYHPPVGTNSSMNNLNSIGGGSGSNLSIGGNSNSSSGTLVNQRVTMSIWDCAGQELYYTSHQMFLTDSALYVVVWNLCKPEVNSRVEFWLHSIRSKAENAPILLIGTHLDDYLATHSESELDEILENIYSKYFRKFRLKGISILSCSTGVGFDNFLDLLKKTVVDLPSLKQSLPELYLKLEKLIIKKRSTLVPPVLTWQSYSQMVLSNLDFHDEIHVKVATKALVPLGSISFFDEPILDQYVFLDPQWLTGVFSSIITTKHKFIKDGVLRKSDLYQIWKPPHFIEDEGLHSLLISLLERFELMFPLDSDLISLSSSNGNNGNSYIQNQSNIGGSGGGSKNSSPFKTTPSSPSTLRLGDSKSKGSPNPILSGSSGGGSSSKISTKRTISGSPLAANVRSRSNSDLDLMSPTNNNGNNNIDSKSNTLTPGLFNELNQKFIIPSQLPEIRPSFGLLWPSLDHSRVEFNRWIQLSFAPAGLFSRLLIRLLISKEFDMKPILYWRNGVVVESQSGKSFLATSTALIEMVPSYSNCSSTIKISVRGDRRTGRGLSAKLLRLIVEIADTLCTSWYHLETNQVIPCPHCINKPNCTLFALSDCEAVASSGVWYLLCGDRKINFETFVPDVAMSDFWGSGSKKFNYDQIKMHKEKRILTIKPSTFNNQIQFDIKLPIESININGADNQIINNDNDDDNDNDEEKKQQQSPRKKFKDVTNELPIINHLEIIENGSESSSSTPIKVEFDHNNQTLIITGKYKFGDLLEIEFESPKLIGRGASGKIYRATLNDIMVAVKQLEVVGEDAPRIFSEFRREIHVMSDLKHSNVVNLLGFTLSPFTMVMEYIDCGDLHKFLHSPIGDQLNGNWALILKLALDIAKGMEFLHSVTPPLLHRDLKSPNVLLSMKDGVYTAKVGDFGLSSRMFIQALKHKLRNFPVGNITWVAPEILREEEYTVKSDVYAFGLILHELLTRKHPYREFNYSMVSLQEDAIKNGLRPTISPSYTQTVTGHEYCGLIQDCWDSDIERRPTFNKIVKRIKQIIGRDVNNILMVNGVSVISGIQSPNSLADSQPFHYHQQQNLSTNNQQQYSSTITSPRSNLSDSSNSSKVENKNNLNNISATSLGDLNGGNDENLGGQLQYSMRVPQPETKVNQLVWEVNSRRVWGGCESGEIIVWNAENGNQIFREQKLHPGPIRSLALVNQEDIWSAGGIGPQQSTIRIWNAWRFNLDDQLGTKSDFITKKGRGGSTFGRKSWRLRWFVLSRFDKTLKYYSKQTDKEPSCSLILEGAWLEEISPPGFKVSLHLIHPEKRTMEMEFRTESEKSSWVTAINRVINQNIPLYEIALGKQMVNSGSESADYITCLLSVGPNVWVSLKETPFILIYNVKSKELISKISLNDDSQAVDQWGKTGANNMMLVNNFVWITGGCKLAQIDSQSFQLLQVHCNHYSKPITSLALVEKNVWVSCEDETLSVWDVDTGSFIRKVATPITTKPTIYTKLLYFSGYLWACTQGSIHIYCIHSLTCKKKVDSKNHPNSIVDLIKVFQQTVWSCCGTNNVCIWS
ncbi:hypothetical protein RB653_004179 [Dictyostelium firmibasis]|uniref:non-specific serine/threonine protein kinase n=1 Tax=Dictyostelium firmibasis TaxID=79012 RepID=A0AAN7TZ13_9MYCE